MSFDLKDLAAQHGIKTQEEVALLDEKFHKHVDINGQLFRVKMVGGRKGVSIALKLKSIALPLIGQGFDGIKNENAYLEAPQTFTQMAVLLNDMMERQDVENLLLDQVLHDVRIKEGDDWVKIDWDEFLIANYSVLIPLLTFALKENFQSFFTGSGMMKGILSKLQNLWDSNQESTHEDTEIE